VVALLTAQSDNAALIAEAREWAKTLLWQTSDPEDDGPSLDDERSASLIYDLAAALAAVEAQVRELREALEEYRLWQPGGAGHAQAHRQLFQTLARLAGRDSE
jgi:hypothetical protein